MNAKKVKKSKKHSKKGDSRPKRARRELPARAQVILAVLVITLAFAVVHGARAVDNFSELQWEDRAFIRHNEATIHSVGDCFTKRPLWPGLYRPLTTNLYYFLGRKLFSNNIGVHHLINVLIYLSNGFLLYLICLSFMPRLWSLIPPAFLVSRFAHVEVVSNTCEFQGLASVFFTLLAFKFFIMGRSKGKRLFGYLSVAAFILALFSKETALVFPALLAVYVWFFEKRSAWRSLVAPTVAAAAWTILFAAVFRGTSDFQSTGFVYNLSVSHLLGGFTAYFLTFFNWLTFRLEDIIMIPRAAELAGMLVFQMCLLAFLAASIAFGAMKKKSTGEFGTAGRILTFGFLFFVVGAAPYVILEARLFMRYGYLAHAGLAISGAGLLYAVVSLVLRGKSAWMKTG